MAFSSMKPEHTSLNWIWMKVMARRRSLVFEAWTLAMFEQVMFGHVLWLGIGMVLFGGTSVK